MNDDTKRCILIADDDRDIRVGTRLRLRMSGFETLEAVDGAEAVGMAKQHKPDCILLDVRMPRMDGLEALTRLQQDEDTSHIPVLMLSASLVDQTAALDRGARYFLEKPYESEKLLESIAVTLEASPQLSPA